MNTVRDEAPTLNDLHGDANAGTGMPADAALFLDWVCDMADARDAALDADDDARNAEAAEADAARLRDVAAADCDALGMNDPEQRRRYAVGYAAEYQRLTATRAAEA